MATIATASTSKMTRALVMLLGLLAAITWILF